MKHYFLIIFAFFTIASTAQKNNKAYKITYSRTSNGKTIEGQDPVLVFSDANESIITSENNITSKAEYPFEETFIIQNSNVIQLARLSASRKIFTVDSLSLAKQTFEIGNETRTILGYKCKKAKTIINSNTIELWFTNDLNIKGAPSILGQKLGLVLEMNRNNNYIITATKIEKIKSIPTSLITLKSNFSAIDALTYRDLLWKSRFITIPVFENEVINFSDASKSNDSILRFANGTIILKKIKFPEIKSGSQVFVDLKEQSNGDAYDRTGTVFAIPAKEKFSFMEGLKNGAKTLPVYENGNGKQYQGVIKTGEFSPLLELMRFFTPFGIKQYGHIQLKDKTWHESVPYRQDISELYSALSNQEVYIGTFIGNYDKGGHKISLNITIHGEEKQSPKDSFVLPLFNTTNIMEMAGQEYATMFNNEKGLVVDFVLEKDIKNVKLRYITTGHGGWENGDEFVPKKNTILLDGKEAFGFIPWRMDCGSYRLFNPASGNFNNGLSSSDYSRSNWCPGTVTNPMLIELGDLKAGRHSIQVKIPQGPNEGGGFSSWNVSGILIGD